MSCVCLNNRVARCHLRSLSLVPVTESAARSERRQLNRSHPIIEYTLKPRIGGQSIVLHVRKHSPRVHVSDSRFLAIPCGQTSRVRIESKCRRRLAERDFAKYVAGRRVRQGDSPILSATGNASTIASHLKQTTRGWNRSAPEFVAISTRQRWRPPEDHRRGPKKVSTYS